MLKTLRTKRTGGFTLVEIMIVVAIIALLASIAVPSFLRARKRTQATRILEELRLVEAAKDQWAVENNKIGTDNVVVTELQGYFKAGHLRTGAAAGTINDSIENAIGITTVGAPVTVHANTVTEFEDLFEDATDVDEAKTKFWGVHLAGADDSEGGEGGEGGGE